MEYAAIIAAAAGVIGSLIGAGKDAEANALREQMAAQYGPELTAQLDQAVAQHMGGTAFGQLQEDDALRSTQLDTLAQLENVYASGGNTAADLAANEVAADRAAAASQSGAASLAHSMAARGAAGTPIDYVLKQQAAQDVANTTGTMARQNAADSRSRALRALESRASLASGVRDQDYRRLRDVAEAQDQINALNHTSDERAQYYNLSLPQQQFDNEMLRRNARSNAANGVAAGYERAGNAARETFGGLGQAAVTWGTRKKDDDE